MRTNEADNLDKLIDSALATYGAAEPVAGLEQRVLNRVHRAKTRPFAWIFAVPAMAALLLTAIVLRTHSNPPAKTVNVPPARVESQLSPRFTLATPKLKQTTQLKRTPSRKGRSPTPARLTAQERALLALVQGHPDEAQEAFEGLRMRSDNPIEIQPIEVPPLPSDGTP